MQVAAVHAELACRLRPVATVAFDRRPGSSHALLAALAPLLPQRFYAHLSAGAEQVFAEGFDATPGGPHLKLALADHAALNAAEPVRR